MPDLLADEPPSDCWTQRALAGDVPSDPGDPCDLDDRVALAPLIAGGADIRLHDRTAAAAAVAGVDLTPGMCAFNPLASTRRGVVALPLPGGAAPCAVSDDLGARYPAQRAGERLLVELPLGALESRRLSPHDDAVPGCHWEVGERVIDNGRVRAELDRHGRIERLSVDGEFAPLAGVLGGAAFADATVSVHEHGPVRAWVRATSATATLDLVLYAHADHLLIGSSAPLDLPLSGPLAVLVAREGRGVVLSDTSATPDWQSGPRGGVRWLSCARPDGTPLLALASSGGFACTRGAEGGLVVRSPQRLALRMPARGAPGIATAALALAAPIVSATTPAATALRLIDARSLVPLFVTTASDADGECLFVETRGAEGRSWLFPTGGIARAWTVDARGGERRALPLTADRDAAQIDYAPGEVLLVRWRRHRIHAP